MSWRCSLGLVVELDLTLQRVNQLGCSRDDADCILALCFGQPALSLGMPTEHSRKEREPAHYAKRDVAHLHPAALRVSGLGQRQLGLLERLGALCLPGTALDGMAGTPPRMSMERSAFLVIEGS